MKIFFNILQPIVNKNNWIISRNIEIICFGFFIDLVQLGVYIVIAPRTITSNTMINNRIRRFFKKNRLDTTTFFGLWNI